MSSSSLVSSPFGVMTFGKSKSSKELMFSRETLVDENGEIVKGPITKEKKERFSEVIRTLDAKSDEEISEILDGKKEEFVAALKKTRRKMLFLL